MIRYGNAFVISSMAIAAWVIVGGTVSMLWMAVDHLGRLM